MAEYPINKGIGRPVEFKGLKAQYLFIFCGGLLALLVLFVILYMVGIDQWICIGFGAASSSVLVWQNFALNTRYGEQDVNKRQGKEQQPGTGGYNIEMPDADKADKQIIGDKAKAYEQEAMELSLIHIYRRHH